MVPRRMRMIPPASSAFDLYLEPKILPTFTPAAERMKVIIPIKLAARMIFTSRNAKVIPTARASILAVSYTHLDVYKRQVLLLPLKLANL